METKKLLRGQSGSGRSASYFVDDDFVQLHLSLAGGVARVQASVDEVHWTDVSDLSFVGPKSLTMSLDFAQGTYLAIKYDGVTDLSADFKPYKSPQRRLYD